MKQVKVFYKNYASDLEKVVNEHLKDLQEKGFDILEIKMEHPGGYFAYIVYNDKVPIDRRKLNK